MRLNGSRMIGTLLFLPVVFVIEVEWSAWC
jgi:hypothetical protein